MDKNKLKGIPTSGWIVFPSPDPFMTAENVMATLSGLAMRFLRSKIIAVKVFTKVKMATPVPVRNYVTIVHSDTLAMRWASIRSIRSNRKVDKC